MTAAGALVLISLAAADPRWGLKFSAPDSCISAAELAERIEARLGRSLFGAHADVLIEGHLTAERGATRWRARLTLVDADGTVKGSREVTSGEPGCRSIDDSLALIAAVMIDPAAALHAPPEKKAPQDAPLPVPPPPSIEPEPRGPPEIRQRPLPPREEWSSYILIERGQFLQNGRWLDRATFYRVVGRNDLDSSYFNRTLIKGLLYAGGSAGLLAGAALILLQTTNATCSYYDTSGYCVVKDSWPTTGAIIAFGVGLAAIVIAAVLRGTPTSEQEDKDLADGYNGRLKPPSLPVTAWR